MKISWPILLITILLIPHGTVSANPGRRIGADIAAKLRPALADHLTRLTSKPLVPFRLFANADVTIDANGTLDIERVKVACRVAAQDKYPAIDTDVSSFIYEYFEQRGYSRINNDRSPVIAADVGLLPSKRTTASHFDNLAKLLFAAFCLLLIKRMRPRTRRGKGLLPRQAKVDLHPSPNSTLISIASAQKGQPPTEALLQSAGGVTPWTPEQGSWHWHAMIEAPPQQLRAAFQYLSLDEALILLRCMKEGQRQQMVRLLELRPAIRSRIDEFISTKRV